LENTNLHDPILGRTMSYNLSNSKLGDGWMLVVYKTKDIKIAHPVAIKFLSYHELHKEITLHQFLCKTIAFSTINLPDIYAIDEIVSFESNYFIVLICLNIETSNRQQFLTMEESYANE